MSKFLKLLAIVGVAIGFASCSSDEPNGGYAQIEKPDSPVAEAVNPYATLSVDKEEIKGRLNDFTFRFLDAVAENDEVVFGEENANFSISPVSVAFNLAMMANSTTGDARDRITTALGVGSVDALNAACEELYEQLSVDKDGNRLTLANSVWYNENYRLQDGYSDLLDDVFDASVKSADFASKSSVNSINSWCEDKTNGIIPKIIDRLDPQAMAVLINAIYYKGRWHSEFAPKNTKREKFAGISGNTQVDMMHDVKVEMYYGDAKVDVVNLSFCGGFDMVFICPKSNIENAFTELTAERWAEIRAGMQAYELDLSLPRFNVSSSGSLSAPLGSMGISLVGNLGSMLTSDSEGWFNICQKSAMKVDEEGAEAAAVTYTDYFYGMPNENEYPKAAVKFDRPFVYMLYHEATGTVVMAGRVCNL